ncbi:MAG TPA: tetratricopeptide repeat protein [Anaeromyxobacteraceae bacterium]|nr:tetratricopeptide repeat protein [Anaeromyxobacteraceae bacterium]
MHPTALPSPWLPLAAAALAACASPGRLHPRAAEEVTRGYRYLAQGDLERAEVAFDHALQFRPDLPEALNGRGIVERRRGRLDAARDFYEAALAAAPDFAEAHVNLGESLLAGGRAEEAEAAFREALAIDPDLLPARLDLARALLHRGRAAGEAERLALWRLARREYLHLLESRPDLAQAWHDLAFMDYHSGDFARAEAGYRRATQGDPRSAEALHGLCIALCRQGRCAEGAEACRRCLEVAPETPECRRSLAGAMACAGGPP